MREAKGPVERDVWTDDGRFESVYRAEWGRMVRLALILGGSREIAEDVVHDAFLRFQAVQAEVVNPSAYLRGIVVNLMHDRHRRLRVEARHRPAPPQPWSDPDIDETWAALRSLPARQRSALVLRFYADLPVDEIAPLLGCPTGTVKSLIHRGLKRLRKELKP